jgi:hypothetical protein
MKRSTIIANLFLAVGLCAGIVGCSKENPAAPVTVNTTQQEESAALAQPEAVAIKPPAEKFGWTAHDKTTFICAKQWGLSDYRANYMSGASHMPDVYDNESAVPLNQQWRHGYVLAYGAYVWGVAHWCCDDNIRGGSYALNGKSAYYYYGIGNRDWGDWYLGYASHYLEDVGNPWHTSANIVQQLDTHGPYETWVENNWTSGHNLSTAVSSDYYYYAITFIYGSVANLAKWSNGRNTAVYNAYVASGKPTGAGTGNATLVSETKLLLRETGRYVKGLIKYTLDAKAAW